MQGEKSSVWSRLRSGMTFNIIGMIVLLLIVFGIIAGAVGLVNFTSAFENEYSSTTYHMADTATTLINGSHIADYLEGKRTIEYMQSKSYLEAYCKRIGVSLVYVIIVDTSDYGRFVSVFNHVDNTVGNTNYVEWELGHKRDTTNDEYRAKYKAIYEQQSAYETVYRNNPSDGSLPHITTMVPVKDSEGEVTGILCIQRPMSELMGARRPYVIAVAVATVLLAAFVAVFYTFFMRRQFVNPISKVASEATRFARENTTGEPLGKVSRFKEISDLSGSIDTMETDMVNYIE
ncbi:MAG: hypothetical protein J6U75_03870, partial [Clostridia bacterium]|nr:hypothetical protein [Clostridia bacterium]